MDYPRVTILSDAGSMWSARLKDQPSTHHIDDWPPAEAAGMHSHPGILTSDFAADRSRGRSSGTLTQIVLPSAC
jgi:hypothetical protein